MTTITRRWARRGAGAALFLALAVGAGAVPTATEHPLGPDGRGQSQSAGSPLAMSPTTFLLGVKGPDGSFTTLDDQTLLVEDHGGPLTMTPLHTPNLPDGSGRWCKLSATAALVFSPGDDTDWATADDALYLFTELGSGNVVTSIPVGFLKKGGTGSPFRLSSDSAVICSVGPDGSRNTADDQFVALTDIGGANTVTRVAAPYLSFSSLARPIVLSPRAVLVSSFGPDRDVTTADDLVYLFTDVGGGNTRTDLPTPYLISGAPGRSTRVTASRAVVASTGADGDTGSTDDAVYLLDDLGGANSVTTIPTGALFSYSASHAAPIDADTVALCSLGADEKYDTADDEVLVISGLGTTNTVQHVVVGAMDEDVECRPVRLAADVIAVVTGGQDERVETADDELAIVTGVGAANAVSHIAIPGLGQGATSTPVALSGTSLLVRNGGPDGDCGGGDDDTVSVVTAATTTPQVMTLPVGPDSMGEYASGVVPVNLGAGRAVYLIGGADGDLGFNADDAFVMVDGLERARDLTVGTLWIKFKPTKPEKGEKFQVKGLIALDTPDLFACNDVTISIGNAAQTIPADAFTQTKKGWFKYRDKKRVNGFIKAFTYKPKNGKVTIVGKGVATGGETTDAGYVPVVIACAELFLGDVVTGELKGKGIKYKAPK